MIFIKKFFYILLSIILTVSACSFFHYSVEKTDSVNSDTNKSGYTVVIDAGHGGQDSGTIGCDGAKEKDINLSIAKALFDYLSVCGIKCVLIRNDDSEFYKYGESRTKSDLYNRLDFVNSIDNSVLVSIHQNHFENESEWGTQIWYSANNPESKLLADSVLTVVKELLQPENKRENKESDNSYYILYKASVPSVMVECGFMSNNKENSLLQDEEYQSDMAYCIACGVCNIV